MKLRQSAREGGQILVIFALSLVGIIAMVGLVLDGGAAFAQRRAEQNASDIAALAAANDLIVNQGSSNWVAMARTMAAQNGFAHGVDGVDVTVTCKNCPGQALDPAYAGVQVTVGITAPHRNNFAAIVGMPTWNISTTATSKTGWPNTAHGPAPIIVSQDAFDLSTGKPTSCTSIADQCTLEHPVGDAPQLWNEFTWTDFGFDTACDEIGNVNNADLRDYMAGRAEFSITIQVGCYIAQHNDGVMNDVVAAIEALAPVTFPVPIVDEAGKYVGWTSFVVTSATTGGRNGFISGYFDRDAAINQQLDVEGAGFGESVLGASIPVKLIN